MKSARIRKKKVRQTRKRKIILGAYGGTARGLGVCLRDIGP